MNIDELFCNTNLENLEYYAEKADKSFIDDKEYYLSVKVEEAFNVIEKYLDEIDFDYDIRCILMEYITEFANVLGKTHFEAGLFTGAKLGYQLCEFSCDKK